MNRIIVLLGRVARARRNEGGSSKKAVKYLREGGTVLTLGPVRRGSFLRVTGACLLFILKGYCGIAYCQAEKGVALLLGVLCV